MVMNENESDLQKFQNYNLNCTRSSECGSLLNLMGLKFASKIRTTRNHDG